VVIAGTFSLLQLCYERIVKKKKKAIVFRYKSTDAEIGDTE